ncbi:hypothetical protein D9M71_824300 [compost metagenome]
MVDAVEQAQDCQGHGKYDPRQHAQAQYADGGQQAQPELEAAQAFDGFQRLDVDQPPAGHQQHGTQRRLGNPGHGRGEEHQDQRDHQRGDDADQLALATDHVVDRGA